MEVLSIIFGVVVLIAMGVLCYMGVHIAQEKREGKWIPLPWEKEKKMGYGKGYSKKPMKKAKKAKKPAMKKKKK